MDKTQEPSKLFSIFYDNGEEGKHKVKSLGEERYEKIEEAQNFLVSKGYFQLSPLNPNHYVKDSTTEFGFAIIINL